MSCCTASCAAARPDALRIFWDVDAPATLAEIARRSRTIRCARMLPALDLVLTYGGGPPVVRCLSRASARGAACRSTTRSIPPRTIPCRPSRASPPTSVSSATACRTGRRGSRSSSCAPRQRCRTRRFLIGGNGWDDKAMTAERPPPRPRLYARAQRLQLLAARRAEHRPRQHGARTASRPRPASSKPRAQAPA